MVNKNFTPDKQHKIKMNHLNFDSLNEISFVSIYLFNKLKLKSTNNIFHSKFFFLNNNVF